MCHQDGPIGQRDLADRHPSTPNLALSLTEFPTTLFATTLFAASLFVTILARAGMLKATVKAAVVSMAPSSLDFGVIIAPHRKDLHE